MNKFKVGDKVKLVSMKNEDSSYKKYLGKIFTIKQAGCVAVTFKEATEENIAPYYYNLQKVEEYTYGDLKKAPIGTKITFQNGYLIKFDKERVYGVINGIYYNGKIDYIILFLKGKVTDERFGKIIKIEEPAYTTVYESKAEILDEAEKRYLRGVIRPFRDRVKYIQKFTFSTGKAKITIKTEKDNDTWYVSLPLFEKDSMYKNMKPDKEYTLEELGL